MKMRGARREGLKEIIGYGAVGAMTTAVNYGAYSLLRLTTPLDELLVNTIAWVVSVAFAYFANRLWVFRTGHVRGWAMAKEAALFAAARLLSLGLENGILWLFAQKMGLNDYWVKLAANGVVIVANYFASKWMIFRKPEGKKPGGADAP